LFSNYLFYTVCVFEPSESNTQQDCTDQMIHTHTNTHTHTHTKFV